MPTQSVTPINLKTHIVKELRVLGWEIDNAEQWIQNEYDFENRCEVPFRHGWIVLKNKKERQKRYYRFWEISYGVKYNRVKTPQGRDFFDIYYLNDEQYKKDILNEIDRLAFNLPMWV